MVNLKTPPHKMEAHELLEWVFDHDFQYWAREYRDSVVANPARIEELFKEEVYDMIDDAIRDGDEYTDYVLDEGDDYESY